MLLIIVFMLFIAVCLAALVSATHYSNWLHSQEMCSEEHNDIQNKESVNFWLQEVGHQYKDCTNEKHN